MPLEETGIKDGAGSREELGLPFQGGFVSLASSGFSRRPRSRIEMKSGGSGGSSETRYTVRSDPGFEAAVGGYKCLVCFQVEVFIPLLGELVPFISVGFFYFSVAEYLFS